MPRALSFANENEIVERLKTVDWKERIDEIHHGSARPDLGVLTAVYSSVGSSTFRDFRASRNRRPSDLFRSCVSKELFVDGFAEFCRVNTNEAYRDWAFHLARQLVRCWGKELDSKLEFTRAMKLVNLLAKALCTVSPAWPTLSHKSLRVSTLLWTNIRFVRSPALRDLVACVTPVWETLRTRTSTRESRTRSRNCAKEPASRQSPTTF